MLRRWPRQLRNQSEGWSAGQNLGLMCPKCGGKRGVIGELHGLAAQLDRRIVA